MRIFPREAHRKRESLLQRVPVSMYMSGVHLVDLDHELVFVAFCPSSFLLCPEGHGNNQRERGKIERTALWLIQCRVGLQATEKGK